MFTVVFTQLTLIVTLINSLSKPLITAQNATGNVRNYQLVVGGIELLNLPLSCLCLLAGMSPISVLYVSIFVGLLSLAARLYMLHFTLAGFKRKIFLEEVIMSCFLVAFIAFLIPFTICRLLPENLSGFIANVIICFLTSAVAIFFVGCNQSERIVLFAKIKEASNRIIRK